MRAIQNMAGKLVLNSHVFDSLLVRIWTRPSFLILILSTFYFQSAASANMQYLSIGTGAVNGVYYPTGGAICYLINERRNDNNIHCEIKSTVGSIYNLNALKAKSIDIAIVQSDWQFNAYNGTSSYNNQGRFNNLRSLFSIHSEPFTVLARKDADIKNFTDIKGKRVNIGSPNSGQRATMEMLLDLYGMKTSDFSEVTSLMPSEQAQALCDKKIDVIVYVVGHPNSAIKEASSACKTKLVNVTGSKITELIDAHRYYNKAEIPAGIYHGSPNKTLTFGVGATVVTTAELSEQVAYDVVKAVFENHQRFVQLHPAFEHLTQQAMASEYLSAPLHPGALRYYKEIGLITNESRVEAIIGHLSKSESEK